MGQFAFSDVSVEFKTEAKAKKAFEILNNFEKIIKERWDGDGEISNPEINGTSVSCKISSGRVQNCEWQVERVAILFSEVGGVEEFYGDIFVEGDSITFSKDSSEETFKEFVAEFSKTKEEGE